jgi:hypothetical protein
MRKLVCLLLTMMMILPLGVASGETTDLAFLMQQKAEEELASVQSEATGWEADILSQAVITDVTVGDDGETATATVTVPTLAAGVDSQTENTDDSAYLLQVISGTDTATYKLTATIKENTEGTTTFKWSGSENASKLLSGAKKLAATARKSYQTKEIRTALEGVLLPKATELPKKQPETAPTLDILTDYGTAVADTLGVSAECAARRLAPLMMLMKISKAEAGDNATQLVLTLSIGKWESMLSDAEEATKINMQSMLGVPEFSRDDVNRVLCEALAEAFLPYAYSSKTPTTKKITVDLAAVAKDGPTMAAELMDFFREYMTAVEASVDRLMEYAATLPYYPEIDLIDTGVLTGASDEEGSRVIFDTKNSDNHAYVLVERNGEQVLSGFIHQGVRLQVKLQPGTYRVYFTLGTEWYGERYFFGKDAQCGYFDLTVGTEDNTRVHLTDSDDGNLQITSMTWDELRSEAGVW